MQSRRDFLSGTVTLIVVPLVSLGCSTDMGYGSNPSSSGSGCSGVSGTSSLVEGHVHTVCVTAAALASLPPSGVLFETSNASGHTHTVALSHEELQSIANGGTVMVTTSTNVGHTHEFALVKMAAPPTPPGTVY